VVVDLGDWRGRAVRLFILAAQHLEASVRGQAIFALGELKAREAKGLFLRALADPEWAVRMFACGAVSRMADGRAVPRLEELLGDEMWLVRQHAARSVSELAEPNDPQARASREHAAKNDRDRAARAAAADALATLDLRR
jgi:HEAT repeat protein